ncbi:MAG TPA: hypothetical protein VFQ07_04360 [Candidatus Polarisedimenticolia bacterium]|nr:hypothetical protein [Candidatus Polarisedimenticolia bacterium]
MTGRNAGGVGPRRLTGYMAAATILAASLLGIAWANSDKAQDKKNQQQGAATQPTQGQKPTPKPAETARPVTRTIGGATVSVDPATGRLVPPTPEQAAALTAALMNMVKRDTNAVQVTEMPDGTLMATLADDFEEVAMATRDAKGNLRLHCVNEAEQAKRVLEGKANVGPVYNEKKAKTTGKKAAQKPGSSFTETE